VGRFIAPAIALLLFVGGILRQFLSKGIADELHAWMPWCTRKLLDRAIGRLPENQRERFKEEWHSHLAEVPGEIGKLIVALGFLRAAPQMSAALDRRNQLWRFVDVVFSGLGFVAVLPSVLLIMLMVKLESKGPVFDKIRIVTPDREFPAYCFRLATRSNPSRLTRSGSFLLKTEMALLPMFLNFMRGDMTLFKRRGLCELSQIHKKLCDKLDPRKDVKRLGSGHL